MSKYTDKNRQTTQQCKIWGLAITTRTSHCHIVPNCCSKLYGHLIVNPYCEAECHLHTFTRFPKIVTC